MLNCEVYKRNQIRMKCKFFEPGISTGCREKNNHLSVMVEAWKHIIGKRPNRDDSDSEKDFRS